MLLFDQALLSKAVEVQKRCYKFLQLIKNDQLHLNSSWSFGIFHDNSTSETERFKELIIANFTNLPEDSRPASSSESDLEDFASFFVSYLFCSFDLVSDSRLVQLDNSPNADCWCELCARLAEGPYLKLKRVTKRDKAIANSLEADAVKKLLEIENINLLNDEINKFLEDSNYSEMRALVSYGIELIRRCEGAYVDGSSLVLWRRFAWGKDNVPKKNFVLTAENIEKAEKLLLGQLKKIAES